LSETSLTHKYFCLSLPFFLTILAMHLD
jgi:hypothetical protein